MSARELDQRLDTLATLLGGHIAGAFRAGEIDRDQALSMFKKATQHAEGLQRIVRELSRLNGAVQPMDLQRFVNEERGDNIRTIDLARRPR